MMGVMATINVYITRLNISIAMVGMVNVTYQNSGKSEMNAKARDNETCRLGCSQKSARNFLV